MLWIRIIGISLVICGWVIEKADHFPAAYRVIAPKYSRARSAFNRIHQIGFVLEQGDIGFDEISAIVRESIKGDREPMITRIKALHRGIATSDTDKGALLREFIELEISFTDSNPTIGKFYEFGTQIENYYKRSWIFTLSTIIFWTGVALTIFSLFLNYRAK